MSPQGAVRWVDRLPLGSQRRDSLTTWVCPGGSFRISGATLKMNEVRSIGIARKLRAAIDRVNPNITIGQFNVPSARFKNIL